MKVYLYILVAIIILGVIIPQQGHYRKWYIILMAVLHTFVCGFRYMYLTGDLRKYASDYYNFINYSWMSEEVFQEGRNTGFLWLMKFWSEITSGDFQVFLIFIALVIEVMVAVLIYRYSPKPWLSYLIWNCLSFYVFGFSAIKQALAMAILMGAMVCILEERPKIFVALTLLAGTIHMPALVFLPAYAIAKRKVNDITILSYIASCAIIFVFKSQIVNFISDFYYEEEQFVLVSDQLGGRFFMIVLLLICGMLLKGFQDKNFEKLFNIIAVAAIFQMFSGFDNIFTRLADYYLQFTVLYIPMIFCESRDHRNLDRTRARAMFPFNDRSLRFLILLLTIVLIWYYYHTCLSVQIANPVDDYLNFRFMWEVIE